MKAIIATIALAIVPSLALPISEPSQQVEYSEPVLRAPYTVSRVDSLVDEEDAVAWHFTATDGSKAGKSTTLKFYQNNDLVKSGKGEAWVLELDDAAEVQQTQFSVVPRQSRPQRGGGRRGGGRAKTSRTGDSAVAPAAGLAGAGLGAGAGAVAAANAPDQLPDIGGLLGSLPALPALPALPDLSAIPVLGPLLAGGGPAAPAAAPAAAAPPGSIVALTTQIGSQIGERIGEPIGTAIGSRIGKAIGQPIGSTIGGAIGSGISGLLPPA